VNLSELITAARVQLDDPVASPDEMLWSDAELVRFANQAQEEAVRRASLLFDETSPVTRINITPSTNIYPVSERIMRIVGASLVGGLIPRLTQVNEELVEVGLLNWGKPVGEPRKYLNSHGTLKLDKTPATNGVIQLEAYIMPTVMAVGANEVLEIELKHHESLIFWIMHRAYEKQDTQTLNPELSAIAANKFTSIFGRRKSALEENVIKSEQPRRVRATFF